MLRDVVELRQNKWVLRREEHYNPKTIDQIHKEAQIEKMQEQRLAVQFPVKNKKQKQGEPGNIMEQALCKMPKISKDPYKGLYRYHSVSSMFSLTTSIFISLTKSNLYLFVCTAKVANFFP